MHSAGDSVVSTLILPVDDMTVSAEFYRQLGLHVDRFNPSYLIVSLAGVEVFHLEPNTDRGPAAAYLNVPDADDATRGAPQRASQSEQSRTRPGI